MKRRYHFKLLPKYIKNGSGVSALKDTCCADGRYPSSDSPFTVSDPEKNKGSEDIKEEGKKADFIIVCPHLDTGTIVKY